MNKLFKLALVAVLIGSAIIAVKKKTAFPDESLKMFCLSIERLSVNKQGG